MLWPGGDGIFTMVMAFGFVADGGNKEASAVDLKFAVVESMAFVWEFSADSSSVKVAIDLYS